MEGLFQFSVAISYRLIVVINKNDCLNNYENTIIFFFVFLCDNVLVVEFKIEQKPDNLVALLFSHRFSCGSKVMSDVIAPLLMLLSFCCARGSMRMNIS